MKITDNSEKILQLIGLSKRASKISTGESAVLESIKKDAFLVVISEDASSPTLKKLTDKCKSYKKDFIIFSDRYTLGKFTGKEYCVSLTLNDKNLAKRVNELFNA